MNLVKFSWVEEVMRRKVRSNLDNMEEVCKLVDNWIIFKDLISDRFRVEFFLVSFLIFSRGLKVC